MKSESKLAVRYAETDQMGIVHHSNYAVWFEIGRADFLKQLGMSYGDIEARGIMLPLYEMSCRFKSPAKYGDEILVETWLELISRVRLHFSYRVINMKNSVLLTEGKTMHAWTDKELNPINAEKAIPELYAILNGMVEKND